MLNRYIKYFLLLLLPAVFSSCRDDDFFGIMSEGNTGNRIVLDVTIDDNGIGTRSMVSPKKTFTSGDVIHVLGSFPMAEGDTIQTYGAFVYSEERNVWETLVDKDDPSLDSNFTWPNNAVSGSFKAYYIYGSDYLLKQGVPTPIQSLSKMSGSKDSSDTDPLEATVASVPYGHTIRLNFIHSCAYLKVEELPAGIANTLWITQEGSDNQVLPSFKNACQLEYKIDETTGKKSLQLDFIQQPDNDKNGAVYVAGNTETYLVEDQEKSFAGFFLAPGEYKSFIVGYPGSDSMIKYLSYTKTDKDIANDTDNPDNILEANGVYSFNIARSTGVVRETNPGGEQWDEDLPPYEKVDAEAFLWAVAQGIEYYNANGSKILEQTSTGTRLIRNIDMDFQEYTVFPPDTELHPDEWFEPNIDEGKVFDGGHHYIHNLGSPLFRYNSGTIKNVGLSNGNMTVVTDEHPDNGFDQSRIGIICNWNRSSIENVRIKDTMHITAQVNAETSQETHNIGLLVGSNTGNMNQIGLSDQCTIRVENYEGSTAIPAVNIGGLIGQNAGGAALNMEPITDSGFEPFVLSIYNVCDGPRGQYSIGGIVGAQTGGTISDVIVPNVTVNSRASKGLISNVGGIAGRVANTSGVILTGCTVSGSVYAGTTAAIVGGDIMPAAYTGGIAGEYWEAASVTMCRSVMNIYGPSSSSSGTDASMVSPAGTYGTGGVFGIIQKAGASVGGVFDLIVSMAQFTGPSDTASKQYIGNFSGILPAGETWQRDYANKEIYVTNKVPNMVGNTQ